MKNIFVDGYNVINNWPGLKCIKEYSLESAREQLIEILSNYAAYRGYKIFIVFDAHMVSGSIEKKEKVNNNIITVFTKEGETADNFIEKMVNKVGRKFDVCVVTSDALEQQIVFQRGATRMSSIEFYHEIQSIESKIKVRLEKKYSEKKNTLEDVVDKDILEKLEKIRRSK
ncbi:NYN domain-containing protein [Clostridium sp. DJ247]|uniref:NYN domain-containing protein n=1 Tax=Clostridium sp. DJ247 TaxID=2726188 RepID=UPI001629D9F9|nr:NYN domain-containing protein [Clostridium sp. DJ247]MBC2582524.1 NYN domain-containing protein [Clostridium sp. DJ247]